MGIEPMASSLPRTRSTTELQQQFISFNKSLKRVKGIEPSRPAWKAGALPLSYTRNTFSLYQPRPTMNNLAIRKIRSRTSRRSRAEWSDFRQSVNVSIFAQNPMAFWNFQTDIWTQKQPCRTAVKPATAPHDTSNFCRLIPVKTTSLGQRTGLLSISNRRAVTVNGGCRIRTCEG